MKKRLLQFGMLGVMFAAVIVGFSNRQGRNEIVPPAIYNFYYYPKANVYYNRTNGEYVFLNSTGEWQAAKKLPVSTSYILDKKVDLTSPSPEIWKKNDQHRMVYAVSLYASAADFREPAPRAELPSVSKPQIIERSADSVVKKDRGIKGFFRKIFHKKKDTSSTKSL